ncbi:hypothetical protein EYF80_055296 [Liparis tanakae]|uniref:Uncharacterized protein n=1 Tax=Liparis tanakae TaxID=230148 RepID=A0A4Z2F0R9_9TELE|nr:hypothetical protein EYF80_055296 [Liparis tanakae]
MASSSGVKGVTSVVTRTVNIRLTFVVARHLVVGCVANSGETQAVHPPIGHKERKGRSRAHRSENEAQSTGTGDSIVPLQTCNPALTVAVAQVLTGDSPPTGTSEGPCRQRAGGSASKSAGA